LINDARKTVHSELDLGEQKIYTLVQAVADTLVFEWSDEGLVALYQKHFITQAALCQIYDEGEMSGDFELVFTPVSVLKRCSDTGLVTGVGASSDTHTLVDDAAYLPNYVFYLSDDNFYSATTASVKALLEKFWLKYDQYMEVSPALKVLGLTDEARWHEVQARYRVLASAAHPDRGGQSEVFIAIRQAYESLKHHFSVR